MDYSIPKSHKPMVFVDQQDNILGYIWFSIDEQKGMYIEMIEMVKKEEGYGTEAVNFLFDYYQLNKMYGEATIEPGMRAYWFWLSLGADMDVMPDEAELYIGENIPFVLYR
jgi:hypothetical protein